jgi:predicted RNA-binding protein with RPS1 domain/GTPase Era involved in 16S rRNA processing
MTQKPENLEADVNRLLRLLDKEPSLRGQHDTAAIRTSRDKAIDPRFEIVFAGTYSAGKSMLINALLGQDLLYSSTGHATGIECYIEYAKSSEEERVELTFLSVLEVQEEVKDRSEKLELNLVDVDITQEMVIQKLRQQCKKITGDHKGSGKTQRQGEADGLLALLDGFEENHKYIDPSNNKTYGMEELGLSNKKAHDYARRGKNSAVLKRIKYYCHYPLLEDGNVLVDLPGIDAPVRRDAELTYRKVEDTNTSAVICVMKADQEGETVQAEQKLIEAIRENSGIGDRVFYVFNRIDKTWRDPKLKQELDDLISGDFSNTRRGIYETSALLGFWASQLKNTTESDRWGLNSILAAETIKSSDGVEGIHQFVREFLDYCDSEKLPHSKFRILRDNAKSKNEQYIDILNLHKNNIVEQLLQDSGIQEFSNAITRYLTEEKRPELFANLASDISELCNDLRESYLEERRQWKNKPANIAAMTERDLVQIEKEVWEVGEAFYRQIEEEIQLLVMDTCEDFKQDFNNLHQKMQDNLTDLIKNFSILDAFANTCRNHHHVTTAPLVAVLGQAFYDIANGLENVLVQESETLIASFFQRLIKRVRKQKYYRKLCNLLLDDDCEIIQELQDIEKIIIEGVKVLASAECVFYIIESPDLYDYEDSVWLYQFRETLQEASKSRDVKRMVEAEEPIRQLLEIDFQAKFKQTIEVNFGSKIIKMLNKYLLSMAKKKRQLIWQQSARARANKRQAIEKEAQAKIDERNRKLREVELKISDYNQAVAGINSCLEAMKLDGYKLPTIPEDNSSATQNYSETNPVESDDNPEPGASPDPLRRPNYLAAQSKSSKKLERGQLVEAKITGLKEYGVFVEVEGTKGLLHISNVSQSEQHIYLSDLQNLFKIGQSIKALIDNLDDGKGGMSLSTKILESYEGEILENMEQVMADAEDRAKEARIKLLKP